MSRTLGAAFVVLALCAAATASAQTSRNVTALANVNYFGHTTWNSAGCSYLHSDGREYVALGESTGTAIYNVTNPSAPALVGTIPGPTSQWREMKQYRNWLYIVSEGSGAGRGLQIVRMTDPEHPVLASTYTATFTTAHSVTVDTTRALLYANGTGVNGMHQLSLANPEAPVELATWTSYYVHDSFARGTRLYASCIYDGLEVVLDVKNPGTFTQLAAWQTPGAFTHNSWVTPDSHYVYCTDETSSPAGQLSFYDISNLASPKFLGQYGGLPNDIVHNVHGKDDTLYVAYYTAGYRIFDIHDPEVPVEVGFLDTSTFNGPSFHGVWEADASLPSGTIMCNDIENGLYTAKATLAYGTVRGTVRDASTNAVLPGVSVYVTELAKSYATYPSGKYGFSPTYSGTFTLTVSVFGYYPATVQVAVQDGVNTVQDFSLTPLPSVVLSGVVRRASDNAVLPYATVSLTNSTLSTTTDGSGAYSIPKVPMGSYSVTAELPGYAPASSYLSVTANGTATRDFTLSAASWFDNAETNRGWTLGVVTDNATAGKWIRANPVGSGPASARAQTEDDHGSAPSDSICFVTANGPVGGSIGNADIDNGRTTLLSPTLDMSAVTDPVLVWWQWYFDQMNGSVPDTLTVDLSNDNGTTWKRVQSLTASASAWRRAQVRVLDYLTPTATMRARFIAADLGTGDVVEAAVDDVEFYPAAFATAVGDPESRRDAGFTVSVAALAPRGAASVARFRLVSRAPVAAQVYDMAGRLVHSFGVQTYAAGQHTLSWDGRDAAGRTAAAGVYELRLSVPGAVRTGRWIRLD